MVSADLIKNEYPLHFLVWTNSYRELEQELIDRLDHDKEKKDPRGRTPLMLAVTLGHVESVRILLSYDANVNCESSDGWTVVQEAVATGDPELVRLVLDRREQQRMTSRTAGIPELLRRLDQAPDFYVEMKWEFTSWVPLVSRMCPSDTYRVYKQGANVRIDTTLLGFDHTSWQRGSRSYVFQGQADGATMMEVDHDARQVYVERMHVAAARLPGEEGDDVSGGAAATSDEAIAHRLTSPIVSTFVDTDKISFERNKAGMWGWRSDRTETVNGHHCKVFSASNVELVTRTRTEHLTESDKARSRGAPPRTPLQSFLGIAEATTPLIAATSGEEDVDVEAADGAVEKQPSTTTTNNPSGLSVEEYFEPDLGVAASAVDVGRPREIASKVQRFRATLWLSEAYPLSLQEQVMPVVDLMAISSTHFAKLRDFVRLQLPAGFPVKVEIPLFHVLNARVTFGNVLGLDEPGAAPGVQRVHEADGRITCVVDDRCFAPPAGYALLGSDSRRHFSVEEEDDLLQFAIQQSLIEAGTERDEVDIWEALKGQRPNPPSPTTYVGEEERQLQRAIQASLAMYQGSLSPEDDDCGVEAAPTATSNIDASPDDEEGVDSDLQMALMLSEQQRLEEEERRLQEQKTLEEILRLSLIDK